MGSIATYEVGIHSGVRRFLVLPLSIEMFETGPNFVPACKLLAMIWVPAAVLYGVHSLWPMDAISMELHPGALEAMRDGEVPPLVAQCETGVVAAHQAGEISDAAMKAALPKCYPLAETHKDSTDIVIAALKFATLRDHDGDGGWTARHLPPAPGAPPPPPPGPDCASTMRHAQLEYVRNRFCEFGPSFTTERTTVASPADLVVAAYVAATASKGAGTGACRMLAVGSDPSVRATATFMAQAGKALRCDVRLYETEVNAIAAHLNGGGSKAYTHMVGPNRTSFHSVLTLREYFFLFLQCVRFFFFFSPSPWLLCLTRKSVLPDK